MALAPPDTVPAAATLRAWLTEAEAAYQRLLTGKAVRVVIDSNGERVEFTAVSADALRRHVLDLRRQLAALECPVSAARAARPIGFFF